MIGEGSRSTGGPICEPVYRSKRPFCLNPIVPGVAMSSPSPYRTAAEVYQDHIQTLGPQLGPVYNALTNEVTSLHGKWNQYRKLFMGSPKRIDLLNATAGYFFGVLQETLIEDILLHLAILTDPPMSVGRPNLTLRQLPNLNDRARFSCTLEQFSESVVRDENGNSPCECSRGDTPQGREFPCRRLSPNCVISSSNGSSKICMPVARPSCVSAT